MTSKTNRYEVRTFINDDEAGYTIFDHVFGRTIAREGGYGDNYAARRGADEALGWLTGESHHLMQPSGSNCQFSTDSHSA